MIGKFDNGIGMTKPAIVLFFNDWKVNPEGINAGGGESSTLALARAFRRRGYRVICCANLPAGECVSGGIEFWNFGSTYRLAPVAERLAAIGPYYCLCATLVFPLMFVREHQNCLARILVNHGSAPILGGIEISSAEGMYDYQVCVSFAQRERVLSRTGSLNRTAVIRNGYDPEVFPYQGPEGRDFRNIVYIGRIEPPKGIIALLQAFINLKARAEFQDVTLSVFGEATYWPEWHKIREETLKPVQGVTFHGNVPQPELSRHLRRAGMLVFPSVSFETAGLVAVDAQASGCPVIAFNAGGVTEYINDGVTGEVLREIAAESLESALVRYLRSPAKLAEMSRACESRSRNYTWDEVAGRFEELLRSVADARKVGAALGYAQFPDLAITLQPEQHSTERVLEAHRRIAEGEVISDEEIQRLIIEIPGRAAPLLWRGLREEAQGRPHAAIELLQRACECAEYSDWQAHFRVTLVASEQRDLAMAASCAEEVLRRSPQCEMRRDLERLIDLARNQQHTSR